MKKAIFTILLFAFIALSSLSACKTRDQQAPIKTTPEPEVTAAAEITKAPEVTEPSEMTAVPTDEPDAVPTMAPTMAPTEAPTEAPTNSPETELKKLDIPIYPDDKLFFDNSIVAIGQDACDCHFRGALFNRLEYLLELFPTDALRKAKSGEEYLIYETESGCREYVFLEDLNKNTIVTKGYPLVICEIHRYEDFKHLNAGDSIDEVAEIDPVAAIQKHFIIDIVGLVPEAARQYCSGERAYATLHYLEDGLLKIQYEMLEDRSLIISNIEYAPDYTLIHLDDVLVNYRIEPIDLPGGKELAP